MARFFRGESWTRRYARILFLAAVVISAVAVVDEGRGAQRPRLAPPAVLSDAPSSPAAGGASFPAADARGDETPDLPAAPPVVDEVDGASVGALPVEDRVAEDFVEEGEDATALTTPVEEDEYDHRARALQATVLAEFALSVEAASLATAVQLPDPSPLPTDGGGEGDGDDGTEGSVEELALERAEGAVDYPPALTPAEDWRLRFPHNGEEPIELLLTVQAQTVDEVHAVAEALVAINAARRRTGQSKVGLHLIMASPDLLSELALEGKVYKDLIAVNPFFESHEIWLQDGGENLLLEEGSPSGEPVFAILGPRRSDLRDFPAVMAKTWGGVHFEVPGIDEDEDGNFGGNLELLTDGRIVVGATMSPPMMEFVEKYAAPSPLVVADTSWLEVGHVDEIFSFLPRQDGVAGTCVVRADGLAGLQILGSLGDEAFEEEILEAMRNAYRHRNAMPLAFDEDEDGQVRGMLARLMALRDSLKGSLTTQGRKDDILRCRAFARRCEIACTLSLPGMRNPGPRGEKLKEVSLPVLYRPMVSGEGKAGALLPNPVNMICLGKDLLVPDPLLPSFRKVSRRSLERAGYRVHFIPCVTYHFLQGQLHCASQVIRRVGVPDRPKLVHHMPQKAGRRG